VLMRYSLHQLTLRAHDMQESIRLYESCGTQRSRTPAEVLDSGDDASAQPA
jgi:hypothetical protein